MHFSLQVHADVPLNPTDEILHLAQAALTPHSCPAGLDRAMINGDEMFGKFLYTDIRKPKEKVANGMFVKSKPLKNIHLPAGCDLALHCPLPDGSLLQSTYGAPYPRSN